MRTIYKSVICLRDRLKYMYVFPCFIQTTVRLVTETFKTSHVQSKIIHMKVNTTDIPNKGVCQLPQFVFHILHHLFSLFPVPEGGQKSGHDNVPMAVLSVGEQRLHNKPNVVLVLRPHLRDDLVIVPRLEYRRV